MKLTARDLDDIKVADHKGRVTLGSRYAGKRFAVREEPDGTAILTPVVSVPENERPLTSRYLADRFALLVQLGDNWDGHGSPVPAPAVLSYAQEVLALLHSGAVARGLEWEEPHIGSNERGQITLEWWNGKRTLTVYIRSEEQVDYLKTWGNDIVSEMEDGELSRIADFASLSRWLYGQARRSA